MEPTSLAILLKKYINDELSETELAQLWETLHTAAHREQWDAAMTALLEDQTAHGLSDPEKMKRVWALLQPAPAGRITPLARYKWRWIAAAAVVATMAVAGGYFLQAPRPQQVITRVHFTQPLTDVKPCSNKAVLTLADGTQVPLDSAGTGAVAIQGNSRIVQQSNGQLTYTGNGNTTGAVPYNNLHIPRGGQFRLTLSDGTNV
ncbi:MAG TPA: hypothetical protein VGC22_00685, partial [Chitinophaga sp.]